MRLSCAVICSFLFVSAVLADYPEKQQPPLLNRSLISITNFATKSAGGGIWMGDSGQSVKTAIGVFEVPSYVDLWTASDLKIQMGIGSPLNVCYDFRIALEINVKAIPYRHLVTYEASALWGSDVIVIASSFVISAGDRIRAQIQVTTPTTAEVTLTNLNPKPNINPFWTTKISGKKATVCRQGVEWMMRPSPGVKFDKVVVTELSVQLEGGVAVVPVRPDSLELHNTAVKDTQSVFSYQKHLVCIGTGEKVEDSVAI